MTRDRYRIRFKRQPHFLTCTIVKWIPIFEINDMVQITLDSLRYLQSREEIKVYGFVIMKDHLHLIASADDLSKVIGRFKSFTARKIIDQLKARDEDQILHQLKTTRLSGNKNVKYHLWQDGSHPILIQNEEIMRQKLTYMHYNPVRKGYVNNPEDWQYSSARNYAGKESVLEIVKSW